MWTTINGVDRTDKIGPKTIQVEQTLNDPMPKARFRVSDQGSQFLIKGLQEVVMLDEAGVASPTINQLINPNWDIFTVFNVVSYWPIASTFTGTAPTITYTSLNPGTSTIQIDVSPTSEAKVYYYTQQSLLGTAVAGQTYTFSATVARASIVNSKAQLIMSYADSNGNVLATFTRDITTAGTSQQVISGLAPANTAFATVKFGIQTLAAGGCTGVYTFSNVQFEAQTFASRGISYPTPLCNHLQANCVVLPSGYTVRQTRLFAGFTSRASRSYAGKQRRWNVEAFSYMKLLDSSYISGTYSGLTDAQIISNLLDQAVYAVHPRGANVRLITGNNVISTMTMPVMTFDTISLLDALNQIADISGCSFYVDNYGDLHYFPWNYLNTPFELSDTPDNVKTFAYSELQLDEDATQPKSRVVVAGGSYTPTWTDSFTGNGTNKQFTLTQLTPQTPITISVAGAGKKVGINGQNTFSQGYDVLLDINGHFILFNVAPANAASVVANYAFVSQIRIRAWDLLSINQTYGIAFDAKVTDSTITSPQTALERGIQELDDFANSRSVLHFKTQKALVPGQVVPITSALDGLASTNFLIQRVVLMRQGGDIIEYQVDAGAYIPDVIAIIKNLHKMNALQQLGYSNGAAIGLLQDDVTFNEYFSFSDSFSVTTAASSNYFYGNAAAKYGFAQYS
jgi:hypothetical protein